MNGITLAVLIIIGLVGLVILWKLLKPYFIKYDTTLCFTGGLGSGKTLETIKTAVILIRKTRLTKYYIYNFFIKIGNFFRSKVNKRKNKYNQKIISKYSQLNEETKKVMYVNKKGRLLHLKLTKPLWKRRKKPMIYANIPVHFKKHLFGRKREWAKTLCASHLLCLEEIEEYSIIVIDELPQFINQFNWNEELIQKNVNEFVTFFRHYIGGYFLANAQSIDDVVVQIRRKLNNAVWCFDFKKWGWPIPLFYTNRMCDIMLSDQITSTSSTFIEENTRLHFGLFPPKRTYSSRCYKPRYNNIYKNIEPKPRYKKLTTTKVLRLQKYTSPLDDTTTKEQKQEMWNKGEKIWEN